MNPICRFQQRIEKQAAPVGARFLAGAKASVPWTLGFHALEQVSRPPHISYETPKQKLKDLGVAAAGGAAAFGTWDVVSKPLKKKFKREKLPKLPAGAGVASRLSRAKTHLKRLPRASIPFLGSLLASGVAAWGVEKILRGKKRDAL